MKQRPSTAQDKKNRRLPKPRAPAWHCVTARIALAVAAAALLTVGCQSRRPPPPPPAAAPRLGDSLPLPPRTAAAATPVLIVQATSSAPNDAERSYSGKIATRLAGWLQESGLPVARATDDDVASGRFGAAQVMVLAYNPEPGLREMLALRRFTARGGKLVVFYSSSPGLANLMGLQLGPIVNASAPGQWAAFRFGPTAPPGLPARVVQDSRLLRPAYPAAASARAIAFWEDASGRPLKEPAWLQSERGFWMTHVLLEGDVAAKKHMLTGLLGACDPALWRAAAEYAAHAAGTLGRFRDTDEAVSRLAAQAPPPGTPRIQSLLVQAESLHDDIVRALRNGDYPRTLGTARLLDGVLTEAYARIQTSRSPEFRAAWNHSGLGLYPGDWDETCAVLARSGFTAVLPNVQKPGSALYHSQVIPVHETVGRLGDQLAAAVEAGRRRHIDVHAWVILWNLEGASGQSLAALRRAGRLQVSASGEPLDWLCPSHPDNRTYELNAIRELATRYAIDGVHLDYVRYKSGDYCFCGGCRTRFARDTGARVHRWPADVRTGPLAGAYRDWRRSRITTFVAAVRDTLRRARPEVKLSAAVYPGYPGCRDSIAQDWGEWLRADLLDFACPMNYSEDAAKAVGWYGKQAAYPGVRGRLYPGIGVTANESRLTAVDTIDQIAALRRAGAGGFVLFDLNATLDKDILPYLRMGLTAEAPR